MLLSACSCYMLASQHIQQHYPLSVVIPLFDFMYCKLTYGVNHVDYMWPDPTLQAESFVHVGVIVVYCCKRSV